MVPANKDQNPKSTLPEGKTDIPTEVTMPNIVVTLLPKRLAKIKAVTKTPNNMFVLVSISLFSILKRNL